MPTHESTASGTGHPEAAGRLQRLVRPERPGWLLPLTGLWVVGLDWLLFSPDALLLGMATPIISGAGFLLGTAGTFFFQRRFAHDNRSKAALKAVLCGLAVGLPWPLAGTVIGGWVLLASGLRGFGRQSRPQSDEPA